MMEFVAGFAKQHLLKRDEHSARVIWLILLTGVALFSALLFNGSRALWDTSETRYAEAAREMVTSGDWLIPRLAGEPHLTKPPVTYWLLAVSMKLFGFSENAVRLPGALAFSLTVFVTICFGWRMGAFRTGILAGILQAISPLAFFGGHVVTTDIFVCLFALMYLWAMWSAINANDQQRARSWSLLMYSSLAVAFLTKGPPALLPALAAVIFLICRRKQISWRRLFFVPGIALFLLISASWYLAVWYFVPDAIAVWRQEALHKVFISSNRDMPAVYYPLILIGGCLPAVLLMGRLVYGRRHIDFKLLLKRDTQYRDAILFSLIWIILPLVIFMFSQTRMILYVLPLAPAVNLLAALLWSNAQALGMRTNPIPLPRHSLTAAGVILATLVGTKALVAWQGDLSKDMKPVAQAIGADADTHQVKPELLITMQRMGNGLLFYLGGPESLRIGDPPASQPDMTKSAMLADALLNSVPDGHSQYIVVSNSQAEKYDKRFGGAAKQIYYNGQWAVFKRTTNDAVHISRSRMKGSVAPQPAHSSDLMSQPTEGKELASSDN
jgi:4-amino-4-deoxy-L-arabinose transferase